MHNHANDCCSCSSCDVQEFVLVVLVVVNVSLTCAVAKKNAAVGAHSKILVVSDPTKLARSEKINTTMTTKKNMSPTSSSCWVFHGRGDEKSVSHCCNCCG